MLKYFKITILVIAIFFIYTVSFATSFGFKTEPVYGVTCNGGSIFNAKKFFGKSYAYPFWTSKVGIIGSKTVLGSYKRTDVNKCYKMDSNGNKTPVPVYIVDKISVSR